MEKTKSKVSVNQFLNKPQFFVAEPVRELIGIEATLKKLDELMTKRVNETKPKEVLTPAEVCEFMRSSRATYEVIIKKVIPVTNTTPDGVHKRNVIHRRDLMNWIESQKIEHKLCKRTKKAEPNKAEC